MIKYVAVKITSKTSDNNMGLWPVKLINQSIIRWNGFTFRFHLSSVFSFSFSLFRYRKGLVKPI